MIKGGVLTKDWFYVLVVTLLFLAAFYNRLPLLERLEYLAYDNGVRMTYRPANGATTKIAIVAIDDYSVEKIGRWPLPRNILADVIAWLSSARAKAIGVGFPLDEPQTDPGLDHIRKLQKYVKTAGFPRQAASKVKQLQRLLARAERDLDNDTKLARTLPKARNIYLPMYFRLGTPPDKAASTLPRFVQRNRLTKIAGKGKEKPDNPDKPFAIRAAEASYPLPAFGKSIKGIGHLNAITGKDGGVRTESLMLEYHGDYYPSLALLLAARSLNLGASRIKVNPGAGVSLGKLRIGTDSEMVMYNGFYRAKGDEQPFATYSFDDVQNGKVPASAFRNKIVLIGATAAGVNPPVPTPASPTTHTAERLANTVASILNQDFYLRPNWAPFLEFLLFAGVMLYFIYMVPGMGTGFAMFLSLMLFMALLGTGHYLMISERVWIKTVSPALLLALGQLFVTTRSLIATARHKRLAETDTAHSNRMLGLSFQAQGQLDMAMDKFRKLPVDKSVLELIYNLALDYERKRQFGKAAAAYDYILEHDRRFRDVKQRKQRAWKADDTLIIGKGGLSAGGTMIVSGMDQKPTLGRYQVEQELGKGAMGTVYLGRDPKINRVVAIKTLALSEEFEENEVQGVKERFFREAETAGRLSHPNIVTIYDAGEEHDLAYIAMEYLQGKDLTHFIEPDEFLPADWVLDMVGRVADALDYAHKQDVVHRDIKPANIMYNEEDDTVKVTDFGIARIVASNRTKTGVILGTPSYMSPEQLAGKRVDGRSDLFSLGATLYELLTGEQPFTGDSMAALMYEITNKRQKDISQIRDDLPACAKTIVDKALQKEPKKRFQSGEEFKQAIEKCLEKL